MKTTKKLDLAACVIAVLIIALGTDSVVFGYLDSTLRLLMGIALCAALVWVITKLANDGNTWKETSSPANYKEAYKAREAERKKEPRRPQSGITM